MAYPLVSHKKPSLIAWQPLKPKEGKKYSPQEIALSCPANRILLEGSRGGGKTETQLAFFLAHYVRKGFGAKARGLIYSITFPSLNDIVAKSHKIFSFDKSATFNISKMTWTWITGETLRFAALQRPSDYEKFHGQEFPFIGVNELTNYADSILYDKMESCNRSGNPEIPLVMIATTNPSGKGHSWVKTKFIEKGRSGELIRVPTKIKRNGVEKIVISTQCYITMSWEDNNYLADNYIQTLHELDNPNLREAWLNGNWDIVAGGGMFDDLWHKAHHIIEPFTIPHNWRIYRAFDYGSSKPFSVLWLAVANGEPVKLKDGSVRHTIKGDIFVFAEWYGCTSMEKPNEGLKLLAIDISKGIIERELKMGIYGRVHESIADSAIFSNTDNHSIANEMTKSVRINNVQYQGIYWIGSDKSRVAGWETLRRYFKSAITPKNGMREYAGLFVFSQCRYFIKNIPVLPRDPVDYDDVDTDAPDHDADALRYAVMYLSGMGSANTNNILGIR